jgi:hypothetical protein
MQQLRYLYGRSSPLQRRVSPHASRPRFLDAREHVFAALRNFETYGDRAAEDIQNTQGLIAEIEQEMVKQ